MKIQIFKQALRNNLRRRGFHFFTDDSLPHGVNVYIDLKRLRRGFPIKTIFDIGANIGQTSLNLAEKFPSAMIYAFEPFEKTFSQLVANTQHLSGVNRLKTALGERSEMRRVNIEASSVFNSLKTSRETKISYEEEILVERLDSFCTKNHIERIDFLKTDTEGFDLEVLKGAGDMLGIGSVGAILCEVAFNPTNQQNTQFLPVYNYLTERGFRFYGLYDTFFLHRNSSNLAFCDALFCHPSFL
jgi:FkbM family methyltransferase